MGIFRDTEVQEIDLVKEMAEALGSSGIRVEESLEKAQAALLEVRDLIKRYHGAGSEADRPELSTVSQAINEYNKLVDRAEHALRWLLIQREACGFRTHRNVNTFYPIPAKIRPLKA